MGTTSLAARRAAGFAWLLMAVAILVTLTPQIGTAWQWAVEAGLAAVALAVVGAGGLLGRRRMADSEVVVVARTAVLAGAGFGALAAVHGGGQRTELAALAIFAAVQVATPAQARSRAIAASASVATGALVAAWLLWVPGDVPLLLGVTAATVGLVLATVAHARTALASTSSDSLRTSVHSAAATKVGTTIDVVGVTRAVLEASHEAFPLATGAHVLLYDSVAERLRPLPAHLTPQGVAQLDTDALDLSVAPGEGLAGRVFSAGRCLIWETAADVHMAMAGAGSGAHRVRGGIEPVTRSAIGTPLMADGEVIGVFLLLSHRQELVWGLDDVPVVTALADEAARAIERGRRYERELDQAHLDSITGLANHRQLTRTLEQEVARARRLSTTLGVVFCDLDRFKTVNDTYGHAAGDRVLTILARVFTDLLRREDSAARYGGDEFVCVLPGADALEAAAIGRRISTSFEVRAREDAELGAAGVTISCGVAIFPDDAGTVDELLQVADADMRRVKAGHHTAAIGVRSAG